MTIDTRQAIMDAARLAVQSHGYTALSFRELGKQVGVKSASVHYHFPTKGDLGAALARQYVVDANQIFETLSLAPADIDQTMARYTAAFRAALENDNRMCLCGIMIAERDELPEQVQMEVDSFTDLNVRWLQRLLEAKYPERTVAETKRHAVAIFAAVEGAQLISRGKADISSFDDSMEIYRISGLFPTSRSY